MYIQESAVLLMARERLEDAMHAAEQRRLLRLTRAPRRPARVRLGTALVRLGHWIQGRPSPGAGKAPGLRQAHS